MRRWIALGIAFGIGLAIAAAIALAHRPAPAPDDAPRPRTAPPSAAASSPPDAAAIAHPPASLRDSEIDGDLTVGADGRFVPDRAALAFFDYFLSATGEEPLAAIRARIEAEVARRLSPAARREAMAFLDQYLAYRAEGQVLAGDAEAAGGADLERRLQWLRELRRKHFGPELAETLFGDDERATEAAIERRRVLADASLGADEKERRLAAIDAALPESVRAARAAALLPATLAEQEKALRAAGGSEGDVRALREKLVGPEAADRLAALDERRAAWARRLDAYRAERDPIARDASLDPAARDAALENLRARMFDARERIRVRTIDEVELGAPAPSAAPPP